MAGKLSIKESISTPKVEVKTNSKAARTQALTALIKGVQASANRIQSYLPVVLNKAVEANAWDWPRTTLRKNGSFAGMKRNIVDTGKLKGSLKVSVKFLKTKTTFTITYSAPYAVLVHEGGYILPYGNQARQPVFVPARPWVRAVLEGGYNGVESIDLETEFLTGLPGSW